MHSAPEININAATVIKYEVIEIAPTRLYVMDMLGRTVTMLLDGILDVSRYSVSFDASALSTETYLYVMQTPTQRFHKLMEVVK